ncbi:hypothetical protein N8I77_006950 [Diaporthe amygdali]|uniref:Ppe family protein n=1 Tax=Phomopsis amygdali TaxID=1214568 RepID=A0AAD9W675_PHOAM|nr:hypothetical protein N8I77_006950 [Diaporthe amygdali]
MKASLVVVSVALQSVAVTALPVALAGEELSIRQIDERSPATNPFTAAAAAFGGSNKQDVQNAASSFAGDVAIVSSSLNGMGTTTDTNQIRTMARKAFVAEKDEDQHRAVLDDAAGRDAQQANKKIVDNTPIVLDGLQSIMRNPSMANTMKQLSRVETSRNANILPSITQLSNAAFQNTGVNSQAKTFDPTTGTQSLKTLMAQGGGTGAATNANAGTGSTAATKGTGAGTNANSGTGSTAATKGTGTAKGSGSATGNAAAKGSAAASTGNAGAKGSTAAAGNSAGAAKGSTAATGKGTGKGSTAATGNATQKGGAAAKGAGADAGTNAGTGNTAAANSNTKGAGGATAATGNAGTKGTAAAAGKGKTNGAGGNTSTAADDEEEDN